MTIDELLAAALTLTPEGRVDLAERLFDSIGPEDADAVGAAWEDEIRRRLGSLQAGEARLIDAQEAKRRIRANEDPAP